VKAETDFHIPINGRRYFYQMSDYCVKVGSFYTYVLDLFACGVLHLLAY
jgi:hypothetical protein